MVMTFEVFISKLKGLVNFAKVETDMIIGMSIDEITDLNRQQLTNGIKADGSFLPDYSETSVKVYGKQPGPMTLEDTGEFHDSFWTKKTKQNEFQIIATSDKWLRKPANLQKRFGSEVLGLTDFNTELFVNKDIIPQLVKEIDNYFK